MISVINTRSGLISGVKVFKDYDKAEEFALNEANAFYPGESFSSWRDAEEYMQGCCYDQVEIFTETDVSQIITSDMIKNAKEFLELRDERDGFNNDEDYESAFDVECNQRDIGAVLAEAILETQKDNDAHAELTKQLEEQGEVVFKHKNTTIAIWETDQGEENIRGEEYMNYMYNLYNTEEFESEGEDVVEYDGGLCVGYPKDAIEMAIEQVSN